jgi:hypothetical protein
MRAPLFCLMMLWTAALAAQRDSTNTRKDARTLRERVWFGGGLGLNLGTVTAIQVEPMVGYKVDRNGKWSLGLGLNYWYLRDSRYEPALDNAGYGYRYFTRYRFVPQLFGHIEFLHLNTERFDLIGTSSGRAWIPHLLAGGGYSQSIGSSSSLTFQILWEVLQDPYSVYRNQGPVISGGIGIGF